MTNPVVALLARATGPTGRARRVEMDTSTGPLGQLAYLLSERNGFFACNAGVQVYRVGEPGIGPELRQWNHELVWKHTYGRLAEGLFCFGQDLFGVQFAIQDKTRVVTFDPETANVTVLGDLLDDWAAWILDDVNEHGCRAYAKQWQDQNGALQPDQRLIPRQFFVLGGDYTSDNIVAKDAIEGMRIRGPIAQRIHQAPDGTELHVTADGQGDEV